MWAPHQGSKKKTSAPSKKRLKAIVVYGSSGGTTGRIAESIAEGLKDADADAAAIRVDRLAIVPDLAKGVDLIGVGSPTYFLREPSYMAGYIDALPVQPGIRGFVFCTCGMDRSGETLHRLAERLASRSVSIVGAEWFRTAMSYRPFRLRGLGNPGHLPDEEQISNARRFGKELVERRNGNPVTLEPVSKSTRLQARLLANRLVRRVYLPRVRLVVAACTGYGSCLSRCLFNGLDRHEGEKVPFYLSACEQCMECVSWCPRDAIVSSSRFKEWLTVAGHHIKLH